MSNKQRYCWQLQNHVWNTNFHEGNWKTTMFGKSVYLFVVLRCGRSCQEMCGTILWVGKQEDSTTLQSINSMHWWPSFQRRRIKIRGRLAKSMLSNCSEMLVLGTYWKTSYFLRSVYKFARTITKWSRACDKRLNRLISYIHHTCEYKQYCFAGYAAKQCRLGLFSRLRVCRRSWGFKINIRWSTVRFWKSHICSNQLDVQETNFSFAQFNRIRNHFFGWRIEIGWCPRTWFVGSDRRSSWKHGSESQRTVRPVYEQTWSSFNTSNKTKTKAISWWSRWLKREEVPQWDMFPEPKELLLIGYAIESIWTPKSKSSTLTPKTNSQTCSPREISHVMNGIIFCV